MSRFSSTYRQLRSLSDLTVDDLLVYLGLEKRRSAVRRFMPALGSLSAGVLLGLSNERILEGLKKVRSELPLDDVRRTLAFEELLARAGFEPRRSRWQRFQPVLVGFSAGLAAGATAGLLLAPERGHELRQRLVVKIEALLDAVIAQVTGNEQDEEASQAASDNDHNDVVDSYRPPPPAVSIEEPAVESPSQPRA